MPFMKGPAPIRRTLDFLEKGQIILKDNVKLISFNFNSSTRNWFYLTHETRKLPEEVKRKTKEAFKHHSGLANFAYWHIPQIQYKNPDVQIVTFKNMTPSPFITVYFDHEEKMVIDCDSRSRVDILSHITDLLGKPKHVLEAAKAKERSLAENVANFGPAFKRECICEVPGQVPCPAFTPLPKHMRGKYKDASPEELAA